jgi:uncharacterized protein YhaN
MRISSISIDGFGIFHEVFFSGLSSGLVLFQGNNETGKSTLLGFIRTILFGFPRANSREPKFPPLAGGTHGGSLSLVTNSNNEFIVERKPGKGGGIVTITGPDGSIGGDELLWQLLGGVTYDVFKNIYAFSLAELQTIDALRTEAVKSVIYGASTGTAILALPKAYKKIKDRVDTLFKPRGSTAVINRKIAELEHVRSELRDASKGITLYDQASDELSHAEEGIQSLQRDLAQSSLNKEKFGSYARLWPEWLALQESEASLKELEEIVESFPDNGVARLDKELDTVRSHQDHLAELEDELQQLRKEAEDLVVDEGLLSQAEAISLLLETRNEYVEKRKSLPLQKQDEKTLDLEIQGLIDTLGKDWSEETVLSIDRSLFTRNTIRKKEEELNRLEGKLATAEKLLADKKDQYNDFAQEEVRARELVKRLGEPEPEVNEQIVQKLKHGRDEFAGAMRDIPKREAELAQEQQQLDRLIREIGPGWTEADVDKFDNSIAARKIMQEFESRLNQAKSDFRDAETNRHTIESNLDKLKGKHKIAISKFQDAPEPSLSSIEELDQRKSFIQAIRKDILGRSELAREIKHQEERISDKREELNRLKEASRRARKWLAWASVVLGVLVSGSLAFFDKLLEASVIGGVFFIAAIVFIVFYRKFDRLKANNPLAVSIEQQINSIETTLSTNQEQAQHLDDKIAQSAKDMNVSEPITDEALISLEDRIEEDSRSFEQRSRLAEEVQSIETEVKELQKDLDDNEVRVDRCRQHLHSIEDEWKEHLKKIRLSTALSPIEGGLIFTKVESIRQQLKSIRELKNRIREMEQTRNNYFALAKEIPSLAEICRDPNADLLSEVDKFFVQLKEQQKRSEERRQAQQALGDKHKFKEAARITLQKTEADRDDIITAKSEALKKWQAWLSERGLSGDLSPQTALEALDKISNCVEKINKKNQLQTVISKLESEIATYQQRVINTLDELGRATPNDEKIAVVVDELFSELEQSKGNLREKSRIKKEIKTTESQLKTVQGKFYQCQQRINSLLQEGGTDSEEAFRRRGNLFFERKRLLQETTLAKKNMQRISGESSIGDLRKSLSALTLDEIQTREKEMALEAGGIERDLEDLRNKRAELKQSIETMKSVDDIARLRADEERLLAEIQGAAFDWARYAMARYLIDKAREKFEREQQPKVIRDAGVFFQKITKSHYTELFAPIGEDTIEVITSKKERKKTEELSRGTAEQLYLAVRFGYIRSRAENSDPLPVIMDDILVNFDPIRAPEAAGAILELSKHQQVLFFTCHPETIEHFKKIDNQVPLYMMENGNIITS